MKAVKAAQQKECAKSLTSRCASSGKAERRMAMAPVSDISCGGGPQISCSRRSPAAFPVPAALPEAANCCVPTTRGT